MFTGIIEHHARVKALKPTDKGLRLDLENPYSSIEVGESIAVNGVCLTALDIPNDALSFELSPETLALTTLSRLNAGEQVNLERAMSANGRFGGHYVSGHVDTTARIESFEAQGDFVHMALSHFQAPWRAYCLPKGSMTVDGVSLTINAIHDETLHFMLIPHTLSHTTLGRCKAGQQINIEFDYLTRIVAHQLALGAALQERGVR